jgi:hypothetical protein
MSDVKYTRMSERRSESIELLRIKRRTDWINASDRLKAISLVRRQLIQGYINRDEYEGERAYIMGNVRMWRHQANMKSSTIARLQHGM